MTEALQKQRVTDCVFRVTTEVILVIYVIMFVIDILVNATIMVYGYFMMAVQCLIDSLTKEVLILLCIHFGFAIYNRLFGLV